MNMNKIDIHTIIIRNPDQLFSDIDGEIVMLNVKNEEYYHLSDSAEIIWSKLEKPASVKDILIHLTEEYEISSEDCFNDVQPFLQELVDIGIAKIVYE